MLLTLEFLQQFVKFDDPFDDMLAFVELLCRLLSFFDIHIQCNKLHICAAHAWNGVPSEGYGGVVRTRTWIADEQRGHLGNTRSLESGFLFQLPDRSLFDSFSGINQP